MHGVPDQGTGLAESQAPKHWLGDAQPWMAVISHGVSTQSSATSPHKRANLDDFIHVG